MINLSEPGPMPASIDAPAPAPAPPGPGADDGRRVVVWDLPLAPWTRPEATEAVFRLIDLGKPTYFITANLQYAMLTSQVPRLRAINDGAAFLLADGAPLVWASRWRKDPLPERVAGSDLIFDLCERAARTGARLYFLGGAEGIAVEARRQMEARYPGLNVVGTASPSPADLSGEGLGRVLDAIREARPDLLMVAFGQPKGEFFIADHCERLGVPVSVQVGATLDFLAGKVKRAPRWIQKVGMEWAYRMWLEPTRLAPRYARNAWYLFKQVARAPFARPSAPARPRCPGA